MSKPRTGGLGRGLDSLFEDTRIDLDTVAPVVKQPAKKAASDAKDSGEKIVYIKIGDIKPNSAQPRKYFDEEALEDLAASIQEHGVIQPVLVRPANKGFELVAGERRWRAARKAGLKEIPAIVRDLDEKQNAFYALIENMQREDLNIIEEALGLQKMMDEFGLNHQETADAVGKSRSYVSNALRLLKLPESVQELVVSKELSAGHARAIAGLPSVQLQEEAAEKAVKEGWSVRKIEGFTGSKAPKKRKASKAKAKSSDVKAIEQQLSEKLGTKVSLDGSENKGKLVLEYYSRSELERLIEILQNQ